MLQIKQINSQQIIIVDKNAIFRNSHSEYWIRTDFPLLAKQTNETITGIFLENTNIIFYIKDLEEIDIVDNLIQEKFAKPLSLVRCFPFQRIGCYTHFFTKWDEYQEKREIK